MRTLLVTLTLADAARWPEVAEAGRRLGAATALLQGEGPSLVEQLDAWAVEGGTVHLVGVTFNDDTCPVSWLGRVARWWLDSRGPQLELWFQPEAVHGVPTTLPDAASARRLSPKDSLTNPAWEEVPDVRRHVLICRGPRCNAKGAAETHAALSARLAEVGAQDTEVLLTRSGCVFPCNLAPVVVVQPDMVWLGPVGEERVPELVAELLHPDPVDAHRFGGTRPRRG